MTLKLITVSDVAALFPKTGKRKAVGEEAIRAALNSGRLGGLKLGGQWFTTEDAVKRWVETDNLGGGVSR